jgi:hypothetical protein
MQLGRAEDRTLHLWPLSRPLLCTRFPRWPFVAALAVLFETLPVLRSGVGNVIWFFVWIALLSAASRPLWTMAPAPAPATTFRDFTGISTMMSQMRGPLLQVDPHFQNGFSLSIGDHAHHRFLWTGVRWTSMQVVARFAWFASALVVALLASLFFHRFDPARALRIARQKQTPQRAPVLELTAAKQLVQSDPWSSRLTPLPPAAVKNRFFSVVVAELRLMLQGHPKWWYIVAAGLFIACLASPLPASREGIILAAWIWPMLIWSQMGSREARYATGSLIFSAPHALQRQLPAVWVAGVSCPRHRRRTRHPPPHRPRSPRPRRIRRSRMLHPQPGPRPRRPHRQRKFFEALYIAWWYTGAAHHLRGMDFTGTFAASSTPALFLILTVVLLAACWTRRRTQLAYA